MANERIARFFKDFVSAAWHCVWEADELVVPVILTVIFAVT